MAVVVAWTTPALARDATLVYVGGYTGGPNGGQGIYLFELRDGADGPALAPRGLVVETENPAFLALDAERLRLFAVGETGRFEGRPTGSVSAFQIDAATGQLTLINRQSSRGAGPCHVVLDHNGRNVLVANYGDGSVAALPVADDGRLGEATAFIQHSGSSVNRDRQAGPHAHCVTLDPSGKRAFVCDLGLDQVLAYKFDPEGGTLAPHEPPFTRLKPGAGPRHMAFHPSGKFAYVINELDSTVTAFAFDAATGTLAEIQTITTLPENFAGDNTTAEIAVHPSGKFLYASNRGADRIACFTIDQASGKLAHLADQPAGGRTPRHFGVSPAGDVMVIANQSSHTLVTCRIGADGRPTPVGNPVEAPTPSCVVFLSPEAGSDSASAADADAGAAAQPPTFRAEPWPEADALFRGDAHWVGGDGCYSIDLGAGRVLWTFGDSLIDPTGAASRKSPGMRMISNSAAIQQGYDPSRATMTFAWRRDAEGRPAAFFPDGDGFRYWPGHGLRVRDRLIVFLMKVRRVTGGLGFDVNDWDAVLVKNPDADPLDWELTWLDSPANDLKVIVGSGAVLAEGEHVYAFSTQERRGHAVYLVRWTANDVYEGRLNTMEWWCGDRGWQAPAAPDFRPAAAMNDAQTEFTVHRSAARGPYLQFQTAGFGPADVAVRTANALTGPWSQPAAFYYPEEREVPRVMIYQGKAHPWLQGADLVATYCTNSFELGNVIADPRLYFPRFLRLSQE